MILSPPTRKVEEEVVEEEEVAKAEDVVANLVVVEVQAEEVHSEAGAEVQVNLSIRIFNVTAKVLN